MAGLFLYLALRDLNWQAFVLTLRKADYVYLPLMFLWGSSSYLIRALRWRTLLAAEKQITLSRVFWATMAGYLGNNILPARAGELIRAVYVSRQSDMTSSFALGTGLVERFIDLITLIILGSVSLTLTGILSEPIRDALATMSVIGVMGLIAVIFLPYFGTWINRIVAVLPLLTAPMKVKLSGFLNQFLRGIEALHNPKRIIGFALYTSIIWTMDGLGAVFLAYVLHLSISLIQAFLLLAGLGLSSAIPSTPGYVGVYQFAAILILKPFGFSNADALALVLFFQISNLVVVTTWGMIAMGSFQRLQHSQVGESQYHSRE